MFCNYQGGGRLRAANSSLPPSDPNMMTRVIATHPPVELVDQRDDHTRVWEIVKEVETTHPDGTATVDTVKSYIREKASGLCYKDASGNYVPSLAEWRETPDGFVIDRCAYGLSIGKKIGAGLGYNVEGHELALRPAYLMVSDGVNEADLAVLNPDVEGFIVDGKPSVVRFPAAFGPGYDLEYVVEKGGFHQNLVIAKSPDVPADFNADATAIFLYTEMNLDGYLAASGLKMDVEGEGIDTTAPDLLSPPSRGGYILFCRPAGPGQAARLMVHGFSASRVYDSPAGRAVPKETATEKHLLKNPSTGCAYLVESLPVGYFRDSALCYPVTWDFQERNSPISSDETWEPRYTYRVTDNVVVDSATLSILPGTTIKLDPGTFIKIGKHAKVVARGEPYNYITFTNSSNDGCGESIPGAQPGPWWCALEVGSVASELCVIQYCKFGGQGKRGVYVRKSLLEPIAHNIFVFDSNGDGISPWLCSVHVHNNVIVGCKHGIYADLVTDGTYTSNTFDSCGLVEGGDGICDHHSAGTFSATDNLFSNCDHGIYTGNPAGSSHHNRFYSVTTPVTGGSGYDNIVLDTAPHDHTCALGDFFLNYNNDEVWEKLIDNGSRTAQAAGLGNDVFSVFPPITLLSGARTWSETWTKIAADSPTSYVDIGYHHNRVDRYIPGTVSFSGTGWLTVSPGATVAMAGGFHPRLHFYSGGGMTSVGSETGSSLISGYNVFADARSVSMHIEAPQFASWNSPYLLIYSDASDQMQIEYTRFNWLTYGILTYRTIPNLIRRNVFVLCGFGVMLDGCANTQRNNLFHRNWAGLYAWGSYCQCFWNTFDTNNVGIYYERSANRTLTARDNLFTDSTPSRLLSPPEEAPQREGIALYGPQVGGFGHDYNAFYGLAGNIIDHEAPPPGTVDIGPNSRDLEASPYDEKKSGAGASWFLKQSEDQGEDPTKVLAVDGGSCLASEAGLDTFTTRKDGQPDTGIVDIGFHRRQFTP